MEPEADEETVMADKRGPEEREERTNGEVLDESVKRLLGALGRLEPKFKQRKEDLHFLRGLLQSRDFNVLMKTHKKLTTAVADKSSNPTALNAVTLSHMVLYDLEQNMYQESQELFELLAKPYVHSVLNAHDQVANKDYPVQAIPVNERSGTTNQFEIVRIDKKRNPLGATVKEDRAGNILISRVLHGSVADRSKQLHTGDVIHEINGESLRGKTIDDVADLMQRLTGIVVFKKSSALRDYQPQKRNHTPTFLRTLFSYSPADDNNQPCPEAGLEFKMRDILSIVNRDDKLWWQAAHFNNRERVGLVPSNLMRESEVLEQTKQKKKSKGKKSVYSPTQEYSGTEVLAYEEVVRIGPQVDKPRPIILIAPRGGHLNIKRLINELTSYNSRRFIKAITHTTRSRGQNVEEGQVNFVTKATFEEYIRSKQVVEYTKVGGHYFGVCSNTIVQLRRQNKVCLLHIDPRSLKRVRTQELMPYVVCIKPPKEEWARENWIRRGIISEADYRELAQDCRRVETYCHWFDATITYESEQQAKDEIQKLSDSFMEEDSWVPATWTR